MKIQSDAQSESYDDFPKVTSFECNLGVCKNPKFLSLYIGKYSTTRFEIWARGLVRFHLKWVFLSASEKSQKQSYSENSMMSCLEQRNPRIPSSDTKCYETSSQKIGNIDKWLRYKPLRGGNLLYIKKNEQFLDDSNDKTSCLYIGV